MQESNSPAVIATRRRHSAVFKRKLLELADQPGASVAAIALEHGINANLLFKWRRAKLKLKGSQPAQRTPVLLPVSVEPAQSFACVPAAVRPTPKEDLIEVEIGGARVLLRGNVDPASLRSLLLALRERA
jgi:transposase